MPHVSVIHNQQVPHKVKCAKSATKWIQGLFLKTNFFAVTF